MKQNLSKLVDSCYCPETGKSRAVVRSYRNEIFIGESKLMEEDADVASSYTGCYIAESKANISVIKREIQYLKSNLKTLENCYRSMEQTKGFNPRSIEAVKIRQHIKLFKNDIEKLKIMRAEAEKNLKYEMETYAPRTRAVLNKIENKRRARKELKLWDENSCDTSLRFEIKN